MKILYSTSMRILKKNNEYYCSGEAIPTIERYRKYFGEVSILARVLENRGVPKKYIKLNKDIEVIGNKDYFSIFLKREKIKEKLNEIDLLVAHMPAIPTYLAVYYCNKLKKTYCSVVVGCAWDGYFNYNFLGKILAPLNYLIMRICIKKSKFAIYVTENFLQKRYPCDCKWINASNVSLEKLELDVLQKRLEKIKNKVKDNNYSIATCAAVNVKFKAQEDVIKAISSLKKEGYNIKYYLAGGGDQKYLKQISKKYKVEKNIKFLGKLKKKEIEELLDSIDLYIQPSKQEGLPRAVIEAMSRGCPCLGSNTAGIPELLDERYIFKKGSVRDICKKFKIIISEEMQQISKRNFYESKKYLKNILEKRRDSYFEEIKKFLK